MFLIYVLFIKFSSSPYTSNELIFQLLKNMKNLFIFIFNDLKYTLDALIFKNLKTNSFKSVETKNTIFTL